MEFTFAGVALLLGMITAIIFIAFLSTKLNACTLISFFALPSAYLEGVVFIRKIILETKEKDEDE
jgi:LytS/YehU family sensor histidine kinase